MEDYDFDRPPSPRGTLGEELWALWHKDAARSGPGAQQKAAMLQTQRDAFVGAVDTIAPPDKLTEVDDFLKEMLGLLDSGLMQGLTRKLEHILRKMAQDDALLAAMSIENRPRPADFLSPVHGKNFLGHLMSYPRMPEVATRTVDTLLAADGLDHRGVEVPDESHALTDLLRAVSLSLSDARATHPTDTVAYSLQSVLASEDARFTPPGGRAPIWAVAYDRRGLPLVARTASGVPPPPFTDADGDGLADVDAKGRWILGNGEPRNIAAFETRGQAMGLLNRDEYGRGSVGGSGQFSFEYLDLNKTGLHFLVRQFNELARRKFLWHLVDAAPALLGPRVPRSDAHGNFSGYSRNNPLNDVFYALVHILDIERLDRALGQAADFLHDHGDALAGLIYALQEAGDIMDEHPDAALGDTQTLGYDLLEVLEGISADPALWRDLFWAFRQPITLETGQPMATLLRHKDPNPAVPQLGGRYDACYQSCKQRHPLFDTYSEAAPRSCQARYQPQQAMQRYECIRQCPNDEMFSVAMDFSAPESAQNRSMFQRLFHLLRDTAGTPYSLQILEPANLRQLPPIVVLPGAAEAFLRSVGSSLDMADFVPNMAELQPLLDLLGGSATLANLLSQLSPVFGVQLSRRVTPDEITRMFNKTELVADIGSLGTTRINAPMCKDGYVMANHHADILYAAEASGMIDTIAPMACAFSMHERTDLMTRIFEIIHAHYSGQKDLLKDAHGVTSPSKGTNLRSFEPALLKILERGTLFDALYKLSLAADQADKAGQGDFIEELRQLVHQAVRTDDGFVGRDGQDTLNLADGRTLRRLSRVHILLDGLERMDQRAQGNPAARAALDDMFSALGDVFLATQRPDASQPARFSDPGALALMEKLTRHLSLKAAELRAQGRLSQWLTQEQMDNISEIWDARALPALVDLSAELSKTPENRALVDDLLNYLLGEPAGQDQAAMGLYVLLVYTLHQDTWIPVSHFLADILNPARPWETQPHAALPLVSHVLHVLHETVKKDPEGRGLDLFARGFANQPDHSVPFVTLADVIGDYFREDPTSTQPFTRQDYRQVLGAAADWIADDRHGMERIYDIVQPGVNR